MDNAERAGRDRAGYLQGHDHSRASEQDEAGLELSITRSKKPQTERAKMERELFTSLVTAVYGDQSGHFAEGTWGVEASDIVRRNPSLLQKYLITRRQPLG